MKMNLLENTQGRAVWDLGNGYYLTEEICSWNARGFKLTITPYGRYLPEIYDCTDTEKTELQLKIQTTSYGSLDPEIIDVVIKGYENAIKTVLYIKEKYRESLENQ